MPKTKDDPKGAAKSAAKGAKGTVHLVIVVDESGSMGGREEAVVTGVNEFLASFRETKADVTATLSMFDAHPGESRVRVKYAGRKIKKVQDLAIGDYRPRGMTPLNDAVVDTVESLDKAVGKGESAFVVIITDGLENASETSAADVARLVAEREDRHGWSFLYLGTGHDVQGQAAAMGLGAPGKAYAFASSPTGTSTAFRRGSQMAGMHVNSGKEAYDSLSAQVAVASSSAIPEDPDEADAQLAEALKKGE